MGEIKNRSLLLRFQKSDENYVTWNGFEVVPVYYILVNELRDMCGTDQMPFV